MLRGGDHGDIAFGCGLILDAVEDLPPSLSQELSVASLGTCCACVWGLFRGTMTITRNPL